MITDYYDIKTDSIVNLKDFYGEPQNIVDICFIIFSKAIHNHLLDTYECEKSGLVYLRRRHKSSRNHSILQRTARRRD